MNPSHKPSRIALIGASRGLGAQVAEVLRSKWPEAPQLRMARRPGVELPLVSWFSVDLSTDGGQRRAFDSLSAFAPSHVICTLGGGPYGEFASKPWKDQLWAYQVTLLFPAQLVHWAVQSGSGVRQLVVVGSSVAEEKPDPLAAAYASAKHGLLGLIKTIREERPACDVRLYSPGYMDTGMLPKNASVRQHSIWSPEVVARDLVDWMVQGPPFDHRRLAVFAEGR